MCSEGRSGVGAGDNIGFSNHLCDGVETLGAGAETKFDFDKGDSKGAINFELVLNAPLRC